MDSHKIADAAAALRHVFLRNMVLDAKVGIYRHERDRAQRIRVNVDLAVEDDGARASSRAAVGRDELSAWWITRRWRTPSAPSSAPAMWHWWKRSPSGSRRRASANSRVSLARVRVEKLDIFADTASVGVEIERRRA